jgi:hypothetical protein
MGHVTLKRNSLIGIKFVHPSRPVMYSGEGMLLWYINYVLSRVFISFFLRGKKSPFFSYDHFICERQGRRVYFLIYVFDVLHERYVLRKTRTLVKKKSRVKYYANDKTSSFCRSERWLRYFIGCKIRRSYDFFISSALRRNLAYILGLPLSFVFVRLIRFDLARLSVNLLISRIRWLLRRRNNVYFIMRKLLDIVILLDKSFVCYVSGRFSRKERALYVVFRSGSLSSSFFAGRFDCGFGKQVLKFGVCGFRLFLGVVT